jgi:hypothetical protein
VQRIYQALSEWDHRGGRFNSGADCVWALLSQSDSVGDANKPGISEISIKYYYRTVYHIRSPPVNTTKQRNNLRQRYLRTRRPPKAIRLKNMHKVMFIFSLRL